jgi:hypothetical protein
MRATSAAELQRLVNEQEGAFDDLCNIYSISRSSGTYGTQTTETRVTTANIPCGFQYVNGRVREDGRALLVESDVLLRLPTSVVISMGDEVELVEKGEYTVSGTFKPAGQPTFNSTVQHVYLKRVTS